MKNIFYIHSHITYYVAKGVIVKLGFESPTILFVISRNYTNKEINRYECIDISDLHDKLDEFNFINFYKKHKHIEEIDQLLEDKLKNSTFRIFLPHVFHPAMQILATHLKCSEIHIIEEGVNAYSSYFMHFKQKSILKGLTKYVLNQLYFVGRNRIFYVKNFDLRKFKKSIPPKFYTVTSKGFKGLPYEVVRVDMIAEDNFEYDISDSSVLVLEGAVEQGNLQLNTFLKAITEVLKEIEGEYLYVKFHPAQSKENRDSILALIKKTKLKPYLIPDEISFEQIILTNSNLRVYGFTTSLLLYAHEYHCKVKSYEFLFDKDLLFKEFRSKNNFDLKSLLNA